MSSLKNPSLQSGSIKDVQQIKGVGDRPVYRKRKELERLDGIAEATGLHPATRAYRERQEQKKNREVKVKPFNPADFEDKTPQERLRILEDLSVVVVESLSLEELKRRRRQFDGIKNSKFPLRLVEPTGPFRKCWVCRECEASHRHHVILLKNGGSVSGVRNVVLLCELCHQKVHPWMQPSPKFIPVSIARYELERAKAEAAQILEDAAKGKADIQDLEVRFLSELRRVFNKLVDS